LGFFGGAKAGNGGNGGDGHIGGKGGNTSHVVFVIKDPSGDITKPVSCSGGFGPSQRPPAAMGDAGIVAITGNPGIGGKGGQGGKGGERGHGCNCGSLRPSVDDGYDGITKGKAADGSNGICITTQ
jgi:hypothetical protein